MNNDDYPVLLFYNYLLKINGMSEKYLYAYNKSYILKNFTTKNNNYNNNNTNNNNNPSPEDNQVYLLNNSSKSKKNIEHLPSIHNYE